MTPELTYLFGSVLIMFGLIVVQAVAGIGDKGLDYGMSNRDGPPPDSVFFGRSVRTLKNHIHGLILFGFAVLIAHAAGISTGLTTLGAALYFWGRLIYAPVYLMGITYLRTLVWFAATTGTLLVLWEVGQVALAG